MGELQEKPRPGRQRRASAISNGFAALTKRQRGVWIIALLFLDSNPGLDSLETMIKTKLLQVPRFRSIYKNGKFVEQNVEDIDMKYHLNLSLETEKVTDENWKNYVGTLSDASLYDLDKPLWRFFLIPELEDGRSLLIASINHAIGDGVANIGVLYHLLDKTEGSEQIQEKSTDKTTTSKKKSGKKKSYLTFKEKIGWFLFGAYDGMFGFAGFSDSKSKLKLKNVHNTSIDKKIGFTNSIPISKIREIKNKFPGATINDVLLAVLSMAILKYLKNRNDHILLKKHPLVRGNFPVNLRGFDFNQTSGNNVATVSFRFPLKTKNRVDTMYQVKKQLDGLKLTPGPVLQKYSTKMIHATMPMSALIYLVTRLNNKFTSMLSNVPGPKEQVHLAGVPLNDLQFLAFAPLGMYLGILSYAGNVSASIAMDTSIDADPEEIAKLWSSEFDEFYKEVSGFPDLSFSPQKKAFETGTLATSTTSV